TTSHNVRTATDLLANIRTQPDLDDVTAYLVLGAGLVGSELAWYLKSRGKAVTLVDILATDQILLDEHPGNRAFVLNQIRELGIPFLCQRTVQRIEGNQAICVTESGKEELLPFECLVLATGYAPDAEFCESIQAGAVGYEVYKIGDCREVQAQGCFNAIHSAFQVANAL
ncbi:hypothetical protein GF339_11055, partial [candidate division KSB3 bacterium]|nr:hypothetical protein [candidate division KSB3 bacterium]MBD3325114.1 hypothetical protein [candidate division KSB3 bacterium]